MDIHSYIGQILNQFQIHPGAVNDFYEQAPELLMQAAERLQQQNPDMLFDAIIVDEAQDFKDEMWIPIPELLKDSQNGILYVFFDDNQRLYTQMSNVPIDIPPFPLTRNCRNTQRIHTTLMPYAVTNTETTCSGPEGRDVEVISVSGTKTAKKSLQRLLHRLVNEEIVSHEEIVILTSQSEKRSMWDNDEILGNFILSWDMQTDMNMAVKVCSIYAYKGLESSVVILSELDKLHDSVASQLLYVGLSCARNHAVILGDLPTPQDLALED